MSFCSGDVTRAAGFLRQFAAYGHKEISSLEPVSVPHVLREMEPILKRVLGNEISLTLPKPAGLFEVDVDSETGPADFRERGELRARADSTAGA